MTLTNKILSLLGARFRTRNGRGHVQQDMFSNSIMLESVGGRQEALVSPGKQPPVPRMIGRTLTTILLITTPFIAAHGASPPQHTAQIDRRPYTPYRMAHVYTGSTPATDS